jgi:LacI family transcriptional regulator
LDSHQEAKYLRGRKSSKKSKTTKLKDIAVRLGVSTVTISKALRDHSDISIETKQKVRDLAKEMNYVPNLVARNLSAGRSNTIGVIIPKIAHFFFAPLIEVIYKAAKESGYEVILASSQEDAGLEAKHIHSLLSMHVDGLIISVTRFTSDTTPFELIKQRGVVLTFIDRVLPMAEVNSITVDDFGGAYKLTQRAIAAGHRRLAHIGGYQHTNIGRDRYNGFAKALMENNIQIDPSFVSFGGFAEEDGYLQTNKLMELKTRPTFIFAATFPVALGVYRVAKELKLRIPEDLDVATFAKSPINDFLNPPMTVVDQPTELLGQAAFDITVENIRFKDHFTHRHIQVPTELILGETCVVRTR